ncbi:MAG: NADH-quinone oxidoreductase subunit C [Phycisphaerales bacterium]
MTELTRKYAALAEAIESKLGDRLTRLGSVHGELGYRLAAGDLLDCARILRDDDAFRFEMLMDVCGVDYLSYGRAEWDTASATTTGFSRGVHQGQSADTDKIADTEYRPEGRFAVVYHLLSVTHNHRVRLKIFCADEDRPMVDSVISIWSSADWYEREAFDLFGIVFVGHPDLRRLLTDYGFIGHPFRKDFPLIGNVEMRYDPSKGRVVYEPVSIEPRTLVPKTIRDDNRYDPDLKDHGDA